MNSTGHQFVYKFCEYLVCVTLKTYFEYKQVGEEEDKQKLDETKKKFKWCLKKLMVIYELVLEKLKEGKELDSYAV
jgi:hypothetical protein